MLTIRAAQMTSFSNLAEQEFIERVAAYLRKTQPAAGEPMTGTTLKTMVANGIRRARSHGLTYQSSIAAFVALMFELGPTFDQYPAFRAILRDEGIPANERVDRLAESATAADCQAASQQYDMAAWFSSE